MTKYKAKEPNCKCVICGKGIYKSPREIKRSKTGEFTCSKEHYGELLRARQLRKIESRLEVDDFKEWLTTKYHAEQMNSKDISEIVYGTRGNGPNIMGWMERLGVPKRTQSEAIALQWVDNDERRELQAELAVEYLGVGTPAREKLIESTQSKEYRLKASLAKRGEKNPMWNPNLTSEEREKQKEHSRRYPLYNFFRQQVYERDDYTCKICNDDTGGNLVVHHLNGFHWDKENRTNVDNAVTLCEYCHREFHSIYGNKHNDLFQFSQYKQMKQTIK